LLRLYLPLYWLKIADPGKDLPRAEEVECVHIRRVRAFPTEKDYYFAPEIYNVIQKNEWDLVHVQGFHTLVAPLAMLAAGRAAIPYVVSFHSGGHSSRLRTALRPLQRLVLRPLLIGAERLIGVSNFEIELFRKSLRLPAESFALIPNGSYISRRKRSNSNGNGNKVIVSVGRLERYKGHHRVIAALPRIAAHCQNVQLRIVGQGPYEPALWQLAENLGVSQRVKIGSISGSERHRMASVLAGASLVILLSDYESQGMAVLEALSLGRPVLVADTSALKELADLQLVRATPLGSTPDQVADAVLAQFQSPHIPPTLALPTWDNSTNALLALYRSVLRMPRASLTQTVARTESNPLI
jgi:glycosyltransferase involved in cell wall biosynthesis